MDDLGVKKHYFWKHGPYPAMFYVRPHGSIPEIGCFLGWQYCWWLKSCTSWGWLFIPLFIGVHTSQVVQDFSHQQYHANLETFPKCPVKYPMFGWFLTDGLADREICDQLEIHFAGFGSFINWILTLMFTVFIGVPNQHLRYFFHGYSIGSSMSTSSFWGAIFARWLVGNFFLRAFMIVNRNHESTAKSFMNSNVLSKDC